MYVKITSFEEHTEGERENCGSRTITVLYDISTLDPFTFGAVTVVMLCLVAFATWIPAGRAICVEPAIALLGEWPSIHLY